MPTLSKTEVMEIVAYCKENHVRYNDRLRELGVSQWNFYQSKKRHLLKEMADGSSDGEFIQLCSGRFVPSSLSAMEGEGSRTKKNIESSELKIECQTSRGGMLRMSGKISTSMLAVLVQNL